MVGSGSRRAPGLHHELFGAGQVSFRLTKSAGVNMEQAPVVEGPALLGTLAEAAETRDSRALSFERLLVAAEHGQDHGPLRCRLDGGSARAPGAVEDIDRLFAITGQDKGAGQAQPGFGSQDGTRRPLRRFHRRVQVPDGLGDLVASSSGQPKGAPSR